MERRKNLLASIYRIQAILVELGERKIRIDDLDADSEFSELRTVIISHKSQNLPKEIVDSRNLKSFWDNQLSNFSTYKERRQFIDDMFKNLSYELENDLASPSDEIISNNLSMEYIEDYWRKALERRNSEPEGAITMARTLLEATCKKILNDMKENYSDKDDLPKLYKTLAEKLDLSPDKQTEQIFKQILGGCQSVIGGLGSLRNKHSDAHGIVKKSYKPSNRHAELAVNLAGTMATFLFETYKENKPKLPAKGIRI